MADTDFTPDSVTLPSFTNAKGVTFLLGDLVTVKGSPIPRRIHGISASTGRIRCVRTDGNATESASRWCNPERLVPSSL